MLQIPFNQWAGQIDPRKVTGQFESYSVISIIRITALRTEIQALAAGIEGEPGYF